LESNAPPTLQALYPSINSPQKANTPILWNALAVDPEGDPVSYKFFLKDSAGETKSLTGWVEDNEWTWNPTEYDAGKCVIGVWVRDGHHETNATGWDDCIEYPYVIEEDQPAIHAQPELSNDPPFVEKLWPDKASPQVSGTVIQWNVNAEDPDIDQVYYKFFLKEASTGNVILATGWGTQNTWTWDTTGWVPADYTIDVLVRDGNHAGPDNYDDFYSQRYSIQGLDWSAKWSSSSTDGSMGSIDTSYSNYEGNEPSQIVSTVSSGSTSSQDKSWWTTQGESNFWSGNYNDAVYCYDRALEIDPYDVYIWTSRGNALSSAGRNAEAIQSYDRALEIDPSYVFAQIGKSVVLSFGYYQ